MPKYPVSILSALLLLAVGLFLAACATSAPDLPTEDPAVQPEAVAAESLAEVSADLKTIVYGLHQEPEILNPFIATQAVAQEVNAFVVEGLLGVDPEGSYYPLLAQEVPTVANGLVSADGMTVRYNLKENLLWSDGAPLTCADVLFTYEAVTDPQSGAANSAGYDKIARVACDSERAVTVQFGEFYAPYLTLFDAILPRHATGATGAMATWAYNWNPIGSGPFTLREWKIGDSITLVANPNYRDFPARPRVQQVLVRFIPNREVGKALITTGEIHILWDLTEADVPGFAAYPEIIANVRPGPATERLVLNLADPTVDATDDPAGHPHPILGDLRVRQALQLGIDKQLLVNRLFAGTTTVGTSELNNGWARCEIAASEYNPEAAARLLEEAGWADGDGDGVRECHGCQHAREGSPLRLKLQSTDDLQRVEAERLLGEMMGAIGVSLEIENVPSAQLFGSWASRAFRSHGHFDLLMYSSSDGLDPQSQLFGYFHSSQMPLESNGGAGFNYSRWVNGAADAAIAAAGATPDNVERKAHYQSVCQQIAAELPHIYLYDRAEVHLSRANILNFAVNPWAGQGWNVAEWDIQ